MSSKSRPQTLPIHQAALRGDLGAVLAELVGGADIDAPSSNGNRPLHLAVTSTNLLLVQRLLELGAKPNVRNRQGLTPLHLAARQGAIDLAQALLTARAKIDTRGSLQFIVQQFPTPLYLAIEAAQPAMAAFLLQHGADPNLLCSGAGETALVMAARQGDAGLVRMLLQHGARADGVDGGDGVRPTTRPLEVAGSAAVVRLLLAAGASIDAANVDGDLPLHELARADQRDRPRLTALASLLRAGACPLARDGHGRTPLQRVRSPLAMRLLVLAVQRWQRHHPESRLAVQHLARSALLRLCENSGEYVILAQLELLQMPGLDVRSRNEDGQTALQILRQRQLRGGLDRDEAHSLRRLIGRLQWLEQSAEPLRQA